jgi:hypothetical protein
MGRVRRSPFWHLPVWKWVLVLALLAGTFFLANRKPAVPAVKVELLPFTDSPPQWDGSYPYVSVSLINGDSGHISFKSSIS